VEVTTTHTTWHQVDALALETETLRGVIVPEMGGKLVSLLDRRSQVEWLAGPQDRPFRPAPYGAPFTEQDMSGWDEMFPTINACAYPVLGEAYGASLPDHGEVWAIPWRVEPGNDAALTLSVEGRALPYRLARTLSSPAPGTLQMDYQLENLGQAAMPYIWAAHPQFDCDGSAQIRLPGSVTRMVNTLPAKWGWDAPETAYDWPQATNAQGIPTRLDQVGAPSLGRARKFFLPPDVHIEWAAVIREPSEAWLRMAWSAAEVPYFGLWIDEGAISQISVAAPEPTTGYYDSLALAWEKREVTTVAPGEVRTWALTVELGQGIDRLPGGASS
jgi:galactose mutarotase-like enzyme